MRSLSLIKRAH